MLKQLRNICLLLEKNTKKVDIYHIVLKLVKTFLKLKLFKKDAKAFLLEFEAFDLPF